MKESSYNSTLSRKIEKEIGGQVVKTSDRSTLGRPDSMHVKDGIVSFFEVKVATEYTISEDKIYVQPWNHINDIRQYEVCKRTSQHALVFYAIYWPIITVSAILTIEELEGIRTEGEELWVCTSPVLLVGHGLERIKTIMSRNERKVHAKLQEKYGTLC